jgi:hypothetical protein
MAKKKTPTAAPRCHECAKDSARHDDAPSTAPQRQRSPIIDLLALIAILSVPVVLFVLDKVNAGAIAATSEFVAAVLIAWKK